MRSTTNPLSIPAGKHVFDGPLNTADIFFANRRAQYLEHYNLTAAELCGRHPGLVHVQIVLHGSTGPWADRISFGESAGAVTGFNFVEESEPEPRLSVAKVVNDYIAGWLANAGALIAFRRRARERESCQVQVSLTRTCLWMLSLGIFDKAYAARKAGSSAEHTYVQPDLITADTPSGSTKVSPSRWRCRGRRVLMERCKCREVPAPPPG